MRRPNTGRGALPTHSSLVHLWTCDETSASSNLEDIVGAAPLTQAGSPAVGLGYVGGYRNKSATVTLVNSTLGADATEITGNSWTVGVLFRLRSAYPSSALSLIMYGGNGETQAYNRLLDIRISTTGQIGMALENGAGVDVGPTYVSNFLLPLEKWVLLHVVKTGSTTYDFYVWGRFVGTVTMASAPDGGTSSRWAIGTAEDGTVQASLVFDLCFAFFASASLTSGEIADHCRRASLQAFHASVHSKYEIKDGLGTYQDLTNYEGSDWVDQIQLNKNHDDPCETCEVQVAREFDDLSMSPFSAVSKNNLTNKNNLTSYTTPLLYVNREMRVSMARVPLGYTPVTTDWCVRLQGHADAVDPGGDGSVRLVGRDQGGKIVDDVLENDLEYPLTLNLGGCGANAAPMENLIADLLSTTGSGGGSHLASVPTLWAPNPSNVCVPKYKQRRMGVMAAVREAAAINRAWDVRYLYDENPSQEAFRLKLVDPGTDRVDGDLVLTREDWLAWRKASLSKLSVRNRIRGTCQNGSNTNEDGLPVIASETVEDAASQAKYDTLFMDFTEGSTSMIDSTAELSTMLGRIRDYLKDPTAEVELDLGDLWEMDLYDIAVLAGDPQVFTADQSMAVSSIRLTVTAEGVMVTAGMRGKPAAGVGRWLARDASRFGDRPNQIAPDGIDWGQPTGNLESAIAILRDRSKVPMGPFDTSLNRNFDFRRRSRGLNFMPDGWFRSTNTGVSSSDPMTEGRRSTLVSGIAIDTGVSFNGGSTLRISNTYQISTEMFPVRGLTTYTVDALTTCGSLLQARFYWYDADRGYLSSSTYYVRGFYRSITNIDDNGTGNAVRIQFGSAHKLVVGDVFQVRNTTNYNQVFTVGSVISSTEIETVETLSGSLAAETSGDLAAFIEVNGFQTMQIFGLVISPAAARYAIFAIEPVSTTAIYLDTLRVHRALPEAYAYRSSTVQTVAGADTWTIVDFNTVARDSTLSFDATNNQYVCPESGTYDIEAQVAGRVVAGSGVATFDALRARLLKNGGVIAVGPTIFYDENEADGTVNGSVQVTFRGYFERGDTITLEGYLGRVIATSPTLSFVQNDTFMRVKKRNGID